MDKKYQNSFNQIRKFLKNDTFIEEPKAMYYINSATLSLLNTAKSISEKNDLPIEEINTIDLLKNYVNLSNSISPSLTSALNNYKKYTNFSLELSNKERELLKKDIQINLSNFLVTIKDFLDSCGALEHLRIQHNVKMGSLNLSKLSVTPEQIDAEFDFKKNSITALPTLITKSAFWANKAVKYIENLKLSILLFEKNKTPYTKENYATFTDKDKITAIFKEEILTRFRNDMTKKLPNNLCFNSLLMMYSSIKKQEENLKNNVFTPELAEIINQLVEIDPNLIESLIKEIAEFHKEYDTTFIINKEDRGFIYDAYSIGNNYALEESLYNYKDVLMIMLGKELLIQKNLPLKYISHFGNSHDRNLTVLNIDLPNYFMPASFHYENDFISSSKIKNFINQLPDYKGFFKNPISKDELSTYILFTPSTEQKKYIKDEFKKNKSHSDSYRTKLLSQMNGMANGKWRDFDILINKQQQH